MLPVWLQFCNLLGLGTALCVSASLGRRRHERVGCPGWYLQALLPGCLHFPRALRNSRGLGLSLPPLCPTMVRGKVPVGGHLLCTSCGAVRVWGRESGTAVLAQHVAGVGMEGPSSRIQPPSFIGLLLLRGTPSLLLPSLCPTGGPAGVQRPDEREVAPAARPL